MSGRLGGGDGVIDPDAFPEERTQEREGEGVGEEKLLDLSHSLLMSDLIDRKGLPTPSDKCDDWVFMKGNMALQMISGNGNEILVCDVL